MVLRNNVLILRDWVVDVSHKSLRLLPSLQLRYGIEIGEIRVLGFDNIASIIAAQHRWQLRFFRQPDHFYFNDLKTGILQSRTLIKDLVNTDHPTSFCVIDEISVVDNATTNAAIILQHTAWNFCEGRFQKGDIVLMLHYAYGAVKKSMEAYVNRARGNVVEVPLPFLVNSNNEIVSEFRKALERGKSNGNRVRLAVIDHVTSMLCLVIPIKDLIQICREEGVDQVFVDAAHSIGCTDVDMKEIDANFYTSNLHKWFFCPPSIAFLYTRRNPKGSSSDLHHPVVSHEG
ncbi:probable L-cysteine desulfhydrase, chloroplastic [Vigna radiata var. radiata]|uniref:Probable L-cysteine desulfhydrase, chloroplastic n=1 Tax=Vigna radiata var. radiata TaxID=3916 RepID=A0A1S3VN14_VIGRR|nr:probable L-cysteine desulfhydrase, chloroplastic [Vigna radiata var. radiata]